MKEFYDETVRRLNSLSVKVRDHKTKYKVWQRAGLESRHSEAYKEYQYWVDQYNYELAVRKMQKYTRANIHRTKRLVLIKGHKLN